MDARWVVRLAPASLEVIERSDAQVAAVDGSRAVLGGILDDRDELAAEFAIDPTRHTDAELVLRAYLEKGRDVLPRLRGMFGFVLLDGRSGETIAARDPLGAFPLFMAERQDDVLVSPSIDALLDEPEVSREVNVQALVDHLLHRWPEPAETYFASVRRLLPGHLLQLVGGRQESKRYWDPAPPEADFEWADATEVASFDSLLEQAVRRALGREPAGVMLSGGLDSASVAAVATQLRRRGGLSEPLALSLVFPHPDADEEDVQVAVARSLGLEQVLLQWDQAVGARGLVREALDLAGRSSAPLLHLWAPAYDRLVAEGVRRGCSVILTGGGGDDWLGVSPVYAADLFRNLKLGELMQLLRVQRRSFYVAPLRYHWSALWQLGARPPLVDALSRRVPAVVRARKLRAARAAIPDWVAPGAELREEAIARTLRTFPQAERGPLPPREYPRYYLEWTRDALEHGLISMEKEELFMHGVARGAMSRAPYWDPDLVQLLYRVSPSELNRGGRSKGLVRASVARRFPELGFGEQRKVTSSRFATTLYASEAAPVWESLGGAQALAEAGAVDGKRLDAEVRRWLTGQEPVRKMHSVWDVLNLEVWLRGRL